MNGWSLLEACDSKEEAEEKLNRYARTIKAFDVADTYGVAVRRVSGQWGVWMRDRREDKDVPPKD